MMLHMMWVYPPHIPDLSSESPLNLSGRYKGDFLKAKGVLGDPSNFVIHLKIQKAKDIPLEKVFAKEIDLLTAQAWFYENKQLEERVTKISIRNGIVSEHTHMAQLETERRSEATDAPGDHKLSQKSDSWNVGSQGQRITLLHSLCVGFGNLTATAENTPPDVEEPESPEAAKIIIKAASNCCGSKWERCYCMCCLQCCSKMNDQSAIVLTQVFTAL